MPEIRITYTPVLLKNMVEIMAAFNIGRETLLEWVDAGAPICVERDGRQPKYSCELAALQAWRLERSKQ